MKISQLMSHLNKMKAQHGDIPVYLEYEGNSADTVYVSSKAHEEYELDEKEKPSIKKMKEDGFDDDEIKDMIKKYIIIDC